MPVASGRRWLAALALALAACGVEGPRDEGPFAGIPCIGPCTRDADCPDGRVCVTQPAGPVGTCYRPCPDGVGCIHPQECNGFHSVERPGESIAVCVGCDPGTAAR